ncbi:MAG: toll/interleukin-1 receptor domain-containing protein [Candidatus Sulfotelmatobacter sp.]
MAEREKRRVFISYAHRDGKDLASRLQQDLESSGLDAWLDKQRLCAGDIWSSEIEQAIDRADVVVALLSAGSFTSDICRAERVEHLTKESVYSRFEYRVTAMFRLNSKLANGSTSAIPVSTPSSCLS